jgi:hypothetical protein
LGDGLGAADLDGREFLAHRDVFFVFFIAAAFSVFYFFYPASGAEERGAGFAEISVDGRLETKMALVSNVTYSPRGLPAVRIEVRDGAAGFVDSDCPDKTCVHSGFMSRRGQLAVCLPNRVVVRILVGDGDALDSTIY